MNDSLFTKIINGDIPSYKIYEDDCTYAFLDIHPQVPGHVLVVPKTQVEFVWDLPDPDYQALMTTVRRVALHLRKQLLTPYVGEKIIGVDVPHAHVHLIPFHSVTDYQASGDQSAEPDHDALAVMAEKLAL